MGLLKLELFGAGRGFAHENMQGRGGGGKTVPLILSDILLYVSFSLSVAFCLLPFPVVFCKQCCLSAKDC